MDDMTSPSNFSEVRWPTLEFMGRIVFYRLAFSAFYRLFCKIASHWVIDLKFSGFISGVNVDILAKFREFKMPRSCVSKNLDFRDFGLWFTDRTTYDNLFGFRASLQIPTESTFLKHCKFQYQLDRLDKRSLSWINFITMPDRKLNSSPRALHVFLVFQSEARIYLSFSQIQPQNMVI